MELEWTSTPTMERRETRNGVRVTEKWLELHAKSDSEICDFAMALADVLTSQLGYDPQEEEEHWFELSAPNGVPSPEGCMEYFDERADEVLSTLWSLEPTAYRIFDYVKTEEQMEYDYGDGDDKYASALFPVDESKKKNKKKIKERRKVTVDFADDEEGADFKDEMKRRFNYPKVNSKYQVVHGKGKTGKSVVVEEQEAIKDPVDLLIKEGCVIIK